MKPYYLLLTLLLTHSAYAQDQHRQHDAHVHGHAELNLVVADRQLLVELVSPAHNLLGFEHRARSEQDRHTLQQTLAMLNKPAQWLQPDTAAGCQLQDIEIESALLKTDHEEPEKHAKHDDHEQQEQHDDHHHQDHGDDVVHSEFNITLSYSCARPADLKSVDASGLFQRFNGISEIEVQWISDGKQSATELSRDRSVIWLQ